MKKLVIYDLDGTLVDTREDIVRAAQHMVRTMNAPELSFDEVCGYVGWGLHDLVGKCLKSSDRKKIEEGAGIFREHYQAHMLDFSRLYPGAREVLDYFRGRAQAVITNKPNPFSEQILKALGVADYFLEIVPGNSPYPKKPDPKALFSVMEKAGSDARGTLFVGDSLIDIETGRNACVETVVMSHGFMAEQELRSGQPDFLIHSFLELMELAGQKGW